MTTTKRCSNCGIIGHTFPTCPAPKIATPFSRNPQEAAQMRRRARGMDSGGKERPPAAKCTNCGGIGHYYSACPEPLAADGETRDRYMARGLCALCGNATPTLGRKQCDACRDRIRNRRGAEKPLVCSGCGEEGHQLIRCDHPAVPYDLTVSREMNRLRNMRARGMCGCGRPLATSWQCAIHAQKSSRYQAVPNARPHRQYECRACGDIGHNARTCPSRKLEAQP
jgi:hypothetical protein